MKCYRIGKFAKEINVTVQTSCKLQGRRTNKSKRISKELREG